jgi:hypothetical protein
MSTKGKQGILGKRKSDSGQGITVIEKKCVVETAMQQVKRARSEE